MKTRVAKWGSAKKSKAVDEFLSRPAFDAGAEDAAREILADIRGRGDAAVLACAKKFDGVKLSAAGMRVSQDEIDFASKEVDARKRRKLCGRSIKILAQKKLGTL